MRNIVPIFLVATVLLLSACTGIGPGTVTRDRFDDTAGPEAADAQVQPPKAQPPEKHYQAAQAALMGGNMEKANLEVKLALQDNPLDAAKSQEAMETVRQWREKGELPFPDFSPEAIAEMNNKTEYPLRNKGKEEAGKWRITENR